MSHRTVLLVALLAGLAGCGQPPAPPPRSHMSPQDTLNDLALKTKPFRETRPNVIPLPADPDAEAVLALIEDLRAADRNAADLKEASASPDPKRRDLGRRLGHAAALRLKEASAKVGEGMARLKPPTRAALLTIIDAKKSKTGEGLRKAEEEHRHLSEDLARHLAARDEEQSLRLGAAVSKNAAGQDEMRKDVAFYSRLRPEVAGKE